MPYGLVNACLVMMPRLQAEEALHAVTIAQIAGGQFEKGSDGARSAEKTLDEWVAFAAGESKTESGEKRSSVDARRKTRTMLGSLGVKIIGKKEGTDDN